MGSPCRVWIVDLISNEGIATVGLLRAVRPRLGWPCVILWSAGLLCSEVGSTFYCPRFWRVLYVWASNRRRSGSWPFFFWSCCLSPPSGVGSASAVWRVLSFTWAMPCGVFPRIVGLLAALLEVCLPVSSSWSSFRVPQVLRLSSPGRRGVFSDAGIAVRALLLATSLPLTMVLPLTLGRCVRLYLFRLDRYP